MDFVDFLLEEWHWLVGKNDYIGRKIFVRNEI